MDLSDASCVDGCSGNGWKRQSRHRLFCCCFGKSQRSKRFLGLGWYCLKNWYQVLHTFFCRMLVGWNHYYPLLGYTYALIRPACLVINHNVYTLATRNNRLSSRRERNSGNSNCNEPHVLWYLRADIWIFHYHVRLPIIIPKALGETLHPHNIVNNNIICIIDHAPKLSSNVERKFVFFVTTHLLKSVYILCFVATPPYKMMMKATPGKVLAGLTFQIRGRGNKPQQMPWNSMKSSLNWFQQPEGQCIKMCLDLIIPWFIWNYIFLFQGPMPYDICVTYPHRRFHSLQVKSMFCLVGHLTLT